MGVCYMFYADTERAAWQILYDIPIWEFSDCRHKVTSAVRTTVPHKFMARLYILEPFGVQTIQMLNDEFVSTYTRNYVGYILLTVSTLADITNKYRLMLNDDERDVVLRAVRNYIYDPDIGFVRG